MPSEHQTPYEIHVTVRDADVDEFRSVCTQAGLKAVVLDLQDRQGTSVLTDMMTSSRITGGDAEAFAMAEAIRHVLTFNHFKVVRQKIESVPWHWKAPRSGEPMPEDCYFESHLAIKTTEDRMEDLAEVARATGCHRSRNIFKRDDDGNITVMLTHRRYDGTAEDFKNEVDAIAVYAKMADFHVDKVEVEFCLYDTKIDHDKLWTMK